MNKNLTLDPSAEYYTNADIEADYWTPEQDDEMAIESNLRGL